MKARYNKFDGPLRVIQLYSVLTFCGITVKKAQMKKHRSRTRAVGRDVGFGV
jgi:hypothetical protein